MQMCMHSLYSHTLLLIPLPKQTINDDRDNDDDAHVVALQKRHSGSVVIGVIKVGLIIIFQK